jgi:hypothetical protein
MLLSGAAGVAAAVWAVAGGVASKDQGACLTSLRALHHLAMVTLTISVCVHGNTTTHTLCQV